jgi:basic amino acid/polyamine antiporter, APA family
MASIMGGSRALCAMARRVVRYSPSFCAGLSSAALFCSAVAISTGLHRFNFGTLLTFFFINTSLLRLRKTMPDARRGFQVPFHPYTPVFAMISCIIFAFYLNANAVMTACVFLAVGIVVYYLNKKGKRDS